MAVYCNHCRNGSLIMKKICISILVSMLIACSSHYNNTDTNEKNLHMTKNTFIQEKKPMELVTIDLSHHEILKQRAKEVKFPLEAKTQKFIQEIREFLATLKNPAGLAAPQVGVSLRIIIIQVPPEVKEIRKDVYDTLPPTVLINPFYTPIAKQSKNKDWEGCFSVPNKMGEVYRYNAIKYEAYTPDGKKITGVAKGFLARLIQHEVGHLNGELYIDLLSSDCRYGSQDEMLKIRKKEMEKYNPSRPKKLI